MPRTRSACARVRFESTVTAPVVGASKGGRVRSLQTRTAMNAPAALPHQGRVKCTSRSIRSGKSFCASISRRRSIFWGRDDIFFTREGGEPLRGGGLPRLHLEAHTPLLP